MIHTAWTLGVNVLVNMIHRVWTLGVNVLKSVRVHFAYGRIALTLELLVRFGRFMDEDDRCNPPVLLIPFSRLLGL